MKHGVTSTLTMKKGMIAVICIIAAYLLYHLIVGEAAPPENTSSDLTVSVVSPQSKTLSEQIQVTGTTTSKEEVMVVTELSGVRVNGVYADVGDKVEKGQKLATLDSESQTNQLDQFQSDFDRANDEYVRAEGMKVSGAISKQAVVQKRTAMLSAKARLNEAKMNVRRGTVVAPQSGVVFDRKAMIGALVNASEPLFMIAQDSDVELGASVPEASLSRLKIGQRATITLSGSDHKIKGTIRLIAPRIDSASRTAMIRIAFDQAQELPIGLFGDANIEVGAVQGMALPVTALQQDSDGDFVWQLDDKNKVTRQPVTIAFRSSDDVLVDGVAQGARIIARAGAFVKEGDHVNVEEKTK